MIGETRQTSGATSASPKARAARFGMYSAFAGVAVGAFVGPLDGSMVTSMVPILTQELDVEVSTIGWVLTIYMLIQTGLMLTFGRLGDLHGHKLVYVGGLLVFLLGTALSSLAATPTLLIATRAVTALGSAAIWANSAAILTHAFPRERRGRALGLQSMMVQLGNSLGPVLGGLVAGLLGWRAIFWVSIPVTLLALVLSVRFIERDTPSGRNQKFDLAGAALYMLGLMAVLVALNQGHAWGWASFQVIGFLSLGLVLLVWFVRHERLVSSPMLDLRLFRDRAFAASIVSGVLNFVCAGATVFLIPIYLLLGRGLTPAEAGLILMTKPIVMCSITLLSGSLSDRVGSRIPATLGMLILALGLFQLSLLGAETPVPQIVLALATIGVALGLFGPPNSSAVMGAVPDAHRGIAAAILSTARTLGNTLGLGLAGAVFATVLAGHELTDAAYVVPAVSAAFTAVSVVALVGAATSAARPSKPE